MDIGSLLKILGGIVTVREGLRGLGVLDVDSPDATTPKDTAREVFEQDGQFKINRSMVKTMDERVAKIIRVVQRGKRSARVQLAVAKVLNRKCGDKWCIPEKDHKEEIKALFRYVRSNVRYLADPRGVDVFRSPEKTLFEFHGGDCFTRGTLVLRDDHEMVPVEALRVGDRIWGKDAWSQVTQTWDRGTRATWLVRLNNGSSMRLTPEHKVWVVVNDLERVRVRDLKVGTRLVQPAQPPTGVLRRATEALAVADITQDNVELPCVDFETSDHFVWLPEADWTVSQCDDGSSALATMLAIALETAGYETRFRVVSIKPNPPKAYSHILVLVGLPQRSPQKWMPLDASVDRPPGWYPAERIAGHKDYVIPP